MKRALVTGITGQDGSYLAELLLSKGYEVHGLVRRSSSPTTHRIDHIARRLHVHEGDLGDGGSLVRALAQSEPDEVYNLGAMTHVGTSFQTPEYTGDVSGMGAGRLLEAIRQSGRKVRFYQASTSELFGNEPAPQSESTPMRPRSPYGAAKLFAHSLVRVYREAYGMYACAGILFNHESPLRRGEMFVSRKITMAAAKIKLGLERTLTLGNLDAKRDWGHAADYMRAVWLMLQQKEPEDFVIASGETHSVREFVIEAFEHLGLDWREHVRSDPALYRPADVHELRGDARLARARLGWAPTIGFRELVHQMVQADLDALSVAQIA